VLLEEPADAFRGQSQLSLFLEAGGDLLEAQPGISDVFNQDPDRSLRAQRSGWGRRRRNSRLLALAAVGLLFGGQVSKLALDLDSIQHLVFVQVGQDGMARVLELLAKFSGRQPGGTACHQITNGSNQAAVFGEANVLVMPNALAVKLGRVSEGVPLAVIGVTPEVADLLE